MVLNSKFSPYFLLILLFLAGRGVRLHGAGVLQRLGN